MKKLIIAASLCLASFAQADDGEAIYNSACVACHGTGIGPMVHMKGAWQARLEAKGGVDGLLESAKQGLNAMPPMGGCNDCSDEQLRAAITYMTTFQ
ncbi:c-type cytochrome [Marinobacterium sp. D7]|uniref:c-type cytochrome n=1 Tax=Marinobacterium ramblicola TaxID=2849041 RepID=UPI001C2CD9CC|nr:c-type cytochrome [Marinobacterium ramblicola]MBV1790319.1 c-type cytochrome [Marinobacterium ramblicola]